MEREVQKLLDTLYNFRKAEEVEVELVTEMADRAEDLIKAIAEHSVLVAEMLDEYQAKLEDQG